MSDITTKQRIIKLIEIFKKETDVDHKLSIDELMSKLKKEFECTSGGEFNIDKKAIKYDIDELNDSGLLIGEAKGPKGKKFYYCAEQSFGIYELRILIDAISSARFLTKVETKSLINKIKGLTSIGLAHKLESTLHIDDMVKSENKDLKIYLDIIHTAISVSKKVNFQYGNFKVNKLFVLHHDGDYYKVIPYALVWSNDFYYLVCFDEKKNKIINYRVDRMVNVMQLDEKFIKEDFAIGEHLKHCFNMYPGEVDVVEIQLNNGLVNAVIDKLGKDVIISSNGNTFKIRFHAAINEGLLRWILMWGADAKVIMPNKLVEMIKNEIVEMDSLYLN